MLRRIVQFCLRFRRAVVALACVLTGYGIYVAGSAKLDVFPNFVPPQVVVQTEAPGLVPEQVEVLVTRPIEYLLNGLGSLESLRSDTISGLSVITVVFKEGTDIRVARQMIAERLAEATATLPAEALPPVMSPLTSSTMDLLMVGLVSDKLSPMELRTLADWTIQPRLLSVPGVAHCSVYGGDVRQLQIQVQPERLAAHGLAIADVLRAARAAAGTRLPTLMANGISPVQVLPAARATTGTTGAGFVEDEHRRLLIQTEGRTFTPEMLGDVVVASPGGQPVRIKDVAVVQDGPEPRIGDALIQARPGVMFSLLSQYDANTLEVTRKVEAALAEMKPLLDRLGVTLYGRLQRPATFIENSLHNIEHSLFLGGVLVAVVLFLFLGNFRTAFISITAIPLSLLTAIILLDWLGVTLNTITLGGLAIAIGEVVDDAIIDVENIFRRLRENQVLVRPRSAFRVVLEASVEVRGAVVYATFVVALVFLPVLTMSGLQGRFFAPLALSYILAIMASLGVALTVTPALCLLFFARGVRDLSESRLQVWLKACYRRMLGFFAHRPEIVIGALVVICVVAVWKIPVAGVEFLPEFQEGHFIMHIQAKPGISLPEMLRLGQTVSKAMLANPIVDTVEQHIGRTEGGEDTWEPNECEFHIEMKPGVPAQGQLVALVNTRGFNAALAPFGPVELELVTFLSDRIRETLTGEEAPIVINVFGDDLDVIEAKAREIGELLHREYAGRARIGVHSIDDTPRLSVRWRPERLAAEGFRASDVAETIQAAYNGALIAQDHTGNRVSDVTLILDEADRQKLDSVGSLMVKNEAGRSLPLKELADVSETAGRYSIMHDGAARRQVVTCTPRENVAGFVAEAKKLIAQKVELPPGVFVAFTGTADAATRSWHELLLHSAIAAAGILLLLVAVTGNWRNLLLILANVPFALIGGMAAILLTSRYGQLGGGGMMIGSLVGFVTLFGITMRNSIMLISHFEHLVREEGMEWGLAAAMRGASERLVPILMTALVTALGLLPLALGSGEAGREIEGPMAIVILGGLLTSTVLNLLFLPTLALHFGRFKKVVSEEE